MGEAKRRQLLGYIPDRSERASVADRAYFDAHPGESTYVREFLSGELPGELPPIPHGMRYAVRVDVVHRDESGAAVARKRQVIALGKNINDMNPAELDAFAAHLKELETEWGVDWRELALPVYKVEQEPPRADPKED